MSKSPQHYTYGRIECKDAMRAMATPEGWQEYCRLSAVKYLWRVGRKGPAADDIRKAIDFLGFLLESIEGDQNETKSP